VTREELLELIEWFGKSHQNLLLRAALYAFAIGCLVGHFSPDLWYGTAMFALLASIVAGLWYPQRKP
jgi:hypothetical protein